MDFGKAFIADAQAGELMQPGEGRFYHPAVEPQPTAVRGAAFREHGFDAARAKLITVGLGVIGPVPLDAVGSAARAGPRPQSSLWASCMWCNSTSWRRCQTPAYCQSGRRCRQVIREPHPNSWGSASRGIPGLKTNRIPLSTLRWSKGLRPGKRKRRGLGGGSNGPITYHRASSSKGLAVCIPPESTGYTWCINESSMKTSHFVGGS